MKLSSRIIKIDRTRIFFGKDSLAEIQKFRRSVHLDKGKVFLLVDTVTHELCLPVLLKQVSQLAENQILIIPDGEEAKTLETANRLWKDLMTAHAGRDALLITLGGGVVTDLGGFVAAGYMRGIPCIHIPTTLLGQVDASIGGKTGINLDSVKNLVGFFYSPTAIFIDPRFLDTLPEAQLRSGLAEIIKSVLVGNAGLWNKLKKHPVVEMFRTPNDSVIWQHLIVGAITFKSQIIKEDFIEKKRRATLNFGHTIGHAIESFSHLKGYRPLLHGEAVAIGMICAAYLSSVKTGLPKKDLEEISTYIHSGFDLFPFQSDDQAALIELMTHDKKNRDGRVRFTLISAPGSPRINISCEPAEITDALNYYLQSS
jgi:3-dehydroquinate synthase